MELAQWLQGNNQIPASEEETDVRIKEFQWVYKIPFVEAVLRELYFAFHLDDPIFLAFDAFNIALDFGTEKKLTV